MDEHTEFKEAVAQAMAQNKRLRRLLDKLAPQRNRQPSPLQGRIARIREHAEARNWPREATEREIARVISSHRR